MFGYLIIFIFGLCVGSFLNVIIYRETEGEAEQTEEKEKKGWKNFLPAWSYGRSYCDHCKKEISWYDNIPLLSYILLRGKCRHCNKKISWQYPLVEFLTGIQFVWIYFLVKNNLAFFSQFEGFYSFVSLILWLLLGGFFIAIFVADARYQIIPDGAVFGAIFITLLKILVDYRYTGMIDLTVFPSALLSSLFFLFLIIITKGKGMGFGDVKLVFLLGLILGYPRIIVALFFAFLTGAFIGVILMLLGDRKFKSKIAFGPFLILGFLIAFIWGNKLWAIFLQGGW